MPLLVNFPAHSGGGWDTVGKKCMFNYFLEHAGGTVLPLCVQVRIQNVLENTKAVFKQNCVWKLNGAMLENWELVSNRRKWTKEAVLQWQRKKQREGWIAFSFLWENSNTKLKLFWSNARIKGHDNILSRSIQITFKVNLCRLISRLDLLIYLVHVESLT